MAPVSSQTLTHGWAFKQADTEEWLPVARVPTNVHLDLMDNKIIEDPFLSFNELKCQWILDKDFIYRVTLPHVAPPKSGIKHVLAFDGLDTYATVTLNGEVILESSNMFVEHRVDVTDRLSAGKNAVLEIYFDAALPKAQKIQEAHPKHPWVGFNADMARLAVRKAQYHFSHTPLALKTYGIDYEITSGLQAVKRTITASVENATNSAVVRFDAKLGDQSVFTHAAFVNGHSKATAEFLILKPKLWYPHGYGEQTLYDLMTTLVHDDAHLHSVTNRTGFRKGELIQEPDKHGKSFYFRINDVDIFCGGSDWIPADSFTPRISKEKYRKWLEMIVDGYQVMIRVWGGGIWEEDIFYELCDELGVMVWQDFMFGCGNYPCFPELLKSIEEECVCQTKRLRHHPSVVIYAGNNEDYQVQEAFGLTYNYEDKDRESWLETDFPARYIYERLLPDVVCTHSPHIPYHPGSPWGDGKISSDPTVGDMHQ